MAVYFHRMPANADMHGRACFLSLPLSAFTNWRVTIGAACGSLSRDYPSMIISTRTRTIASAIVLSLAVVACGPKDADIKASVDAAIAGVPGVSVNVVKGRRDHLRSVR